MTLTARMTKSQKRRAYREAVQASLTTFYQTSEPVSKKLVTAWWKRLSDTSAFKSDLFMHSEPLNTAADLIHAEVIPITSDIREAYRRILSESRDRALHPKGRGKVVEMAYSDRPVFARTITKASKRVAEQQKLLAAGS